MLYVCLSFFFKKIWIRYWVLKRLGIYTLCFEVMQGKIVKWMSIRACILILCLKIVKIVWIFISTSALSMIICLRLLANITLYLCFVWSFVTLLLQLQFTLFFMLNSWTFLCVRITASSSVGRATWNPLPLFFSR